MDNVNEESVNSIMNGGPALGLPTDGTGMRRLPFLGVIETAG